MMFTSEKNFLEQILPAFQQGQEILVGPGDDCAVLQLLPPPQPCYLLAVDQVIAGIHYDPELVSPGQVARKLLNRNLSDIAAMGGRPAQAVVALATAWQQDRWFVEFYQALAEEAKKWDISVCGGDVASAPENVTVASLTITGWVEPDRLCLRSTANPGDHIYVTGSFGNSYQSGHHASFTPRLREAWFLAGLYTRSAINVSDGLLLDLGRICEKSHVGACLDLSRIPLRAGASIRQALGDGEDYELIFAVPPSLTAQLKSAWPFPWTDLTCIGAFTAGHDGEIYDLDNNPITIQKGTMTCHGFDHFQKQSCHHPLSPGNR